MKRNLAEFVRRGISACSLGPLVLAVFYLIMNGLGLMETLSVKEVCTGIFSLSALAFLAGGINAVYRIERLPLMAAVTVHGAVLYAGYLGTYLVNGWLEWGTAPILVFSGIFVVGYLVIWAIIYLLIRKNTEKLNRMLKQKQLSEET